jgi:hypothetical protein
MSIEALFTIVNLQKQVRCPTTDEWIKKLYTMELYSDTKKMKFCGSQVNGWNGKHHLK